MKILPLLLILAVGSPLAWSAEPDRDSAVKSAREEARRADTDRSAAREEMARLQRELAALSRRMSELSLSMSDQAPRLAALRYLGSADRAMVGIVLSESADGVRIAGLTPDGPAARAGLKTGDVIVAIDGKTIRSNDPGQVRELLRELKDGQKVVIGYRRDGKPGDATVTASRREAASGIHLLADGDEGVDGLRRNVEVIVRDALEDAGQARRDAVKAAREQRQAESGAARAMRDAYRAQVDVQRSLRATPWWGIQLAELNPRLGRYFGTDKGVLVVANDGGTLKDIEAGDVIQQIAGKPVDRPEEVLRRLRDQPADGKVELQLFRDRKSKTVSVTTPPQRTLFDIAPPPPLPPVAPTAPTPPTPPAAPSRSTPAPPPPPATPPVPREPDLT